MTTPLFPIRSTAWTWSSIDDLVIHQQAIQESRSGYLSLSTQSLESDSNGPEVQYALDLTFD
jgi:hypothetical protein